MVYYSGRCYAACQRRGKPQSAGARAPCAPRRRAVAHRETWMKHCLYCDAGFSDTGWRCPRCGREPGSVLGFPAFAPELADANDGLDPEVHHVLDQRQQESFWFRARSRLVVDLANRYFPAARSAFEVGCGTGYVLSSLQAARPGLRLSGSEIYSNALPYARRRLGEDVELFQMDARAIPFRDEFDLVCAFDVLEHIEEDTLVLANLRDALCPGGGALLSVPQHPSLWSQTDEFAHHKRRYKAGELAAKCRAAGFEVLRSTSFVSTLLPLMAAQRLSRARRETYDTTSELMLHPALDAGLEVLLDIERKAIGAGISFPIGGSRFVVARKPA
jgi:SAM-dependent methyltransferase